MSPTQPSPAVAGATVLVPRHRLASPTGDMTTRSAPLEDGMRWAVRPGESRSPFPEPGFPFLRRLVSRGAMAAQWECRFDRETDRWLSWHEVDAKPTVPGTFMLEMAAEAARSLRPGRMVTGFRNASFDAFIRPFTGRTQMVLQISASATAHDEIHVVLESRRETTSGQTLGRRVTHFSTVVTLSDTRLEAPRVEPPEAARRVPVRDPYYATGSPVALRRIFENTKNPTSDGRQIWKLTDWDPLLECLNITPLLLDATLRTQALVPTQDGRHEVLVPRRMGRIVLYSPGNDLSISREHEGEIALWYDRLTGTFTACANGRALLQVTAAATEPMGALPLASPSVSAP